MSDDENTPVFTAYDLLKKGGRWLGAARERIQTMKCFGNGESVTWGSNDVIQPPMTIAQVEEIAATAAAAAFTERAKMEAQIAKMREQHLRSSLELSCRAEAAERALAELRAQARAMIPDAFKAADEEQAQGQRIRKEVLKEAAQFAYCEMVDADRASEVAEYQGNRDEFKYMRGKVTAARVIGNQLEKMAEETKG